MTNVKIKQFKPSGSLSVVIPRSKSMTNRALIMAAMAEGRSRLFRILQSDDSKYCQDVLKSLGVAITGDNDVDLEINSPGIEKLKSSEDLYIGSAGTVARFLPGLLAASQSNELYTIVSSDQLKSRPIQPLFEALEKCGANIVFKDKKYHFPIIVQGKVIRGGEVAISGDVSSQFISGLLMAAPYFSEGLRLHITTPIVQKRYVEMTIAMMKSFGVHVDAHDEYNFFNVSTNQRYQPQAYQVEVDVSTAGYFFAMGVLLETEIYVDVNRDTLQPDIELLDIIKQFGADVAWAESGVCVRGRGRIRGNQVFDLSECSDQALTVGVLSSFADGPVTLIGIGHIRYHESNRIQVLHDNLKLLGVKTKMNVDGITIYPSEMNTGITLPTYDDHRVAMAFSLVGLKVGDITIENSECTNKTFPGYFDYLEKLGVVIEKRE